MMGMNAVKEKERERQRGNGDFSMSGMTGMRTLLFSMTVVVHPPLL
jgi:hypothetical protein